MSKEDGNLENGFVWWNPAVFQSLRRQVIFTGCKSLVKTGPKRQDWRNKLRQLFRRTWLVLNILNISTSKRLLYTWTPYKHRKWVVLGVRLPEMSRATAQYYCLISYRAGAWHYRIFPDFLNSRFKMASNTEEGDIGGYPIPQYRKKKWQIPKYRVENRLNTDTAYFNHIHNRLRILMGASI